MTALSSLREPTRVLLGDIPETTAEQTYSDVAIDKGLRSVVDMGLLDVTGRTYRMYDTNNILQDMTVAADKLLLCAQVAKIFAQSEPSKKSVSTRAFRSSIGDFKELIRQLDRIIYDLTSGHGVYGFRSFSLWLTDVSPALAEWWERYEGGEDTSALLV